MSRRDTRTIEEQERDYYRAEAERHDERRNEVITRGELLDVLEGVILERGGNCLDWQIAVVETLEALRKALE